MSVLHHPSCRYKPLIEKRSHTPQHAPIFRSPFCWLHRHILLQRGTTLKLYHSLINRYIFSWNINLSNLFLKVVHQRSNFAKAIICLCTWRRKRRVVCKMQISGDVFKPFSADTICNRGIMMNTVSFPVHF